jgi:hypothetical protein
MLPLLKKLLQHQYTVLVLNPYVNTGNVYVTYIFDDLRAVYPDLPIPGSESPTKHTSYVFENFVLKNNIKQVGIIACGQGGTCALSLFSSRGFFY